MRRLLLALAIIAGLLQGMQPAHAEPFLALRQGLKCAACHVNPTGGGMRTEYGNAFAQMQLAATQLAKADADRWNGRVNSWIAVGGDLRANAVLDDVPGQEQAAAFELEEARFYLDFSPLPGRVDVYLDQRVAPGSSTSLEAYARLWSQDRNWYLQAGQMYLPYGLRLEDDSAFIRSVPGINFTTPDTGVQLGWEQGAWTSQLAVSNGTAGGAEDGNGKQVSARIEYVQSSWRIGGSANTNDVDTGTRNMANLFAGLRTGSVGWLAELDHVRDDSGASVLVQDIGLIEANWNFKPGQNLKLTAEHLEVDGVDEAQERLSIFWEYFPFEYTELRVGVRRYDGNPDIDVQNRSQFLVQLHGFF